MCGLRTLKWDDDVTAGKTRARTSAHNMKNGILFKYTSMMNALCRKLIRATKFNQSVQIEIMSERAL
jgi:hypothetical protein